MTDNEKKIDFQHETVLKNEAIDGLGLVDGGVYVDATFGGGGHSRQILETCQTCRVIGIDWDQDVVEHVVPSIEQEYKGRLKVLWGSFCQIYKLLQKEKIIKVDGILADFGTSQHQIFQKEGFSFASDSFLDMRMSKSHSRITASYIVNNFSEKELSQLFFDLGQERFSREISRKIVEERRSKRITMTKELADLVSSVVHRFSKTKNRKKTHPATKVFQALRIFVNKELDNIEMFLNSVIGLIKPGGRLVCISFHSLEDSIVKKFFKEKEREGRLKIMTKKVVIATEEEVDRNPSSRSAKMRVAEYL